MKVKIHFTKAYEREVEISARNYFLLTMDVNAVPGVFPEGAEDRTFSKISELDEASRAELERLYDKLVGRS